ncbi:MAG: aminotransferase class I/II-fold pyridoxal phosphate-dependent enzyme, partial [Desulfobacterales bacterium]
YADYEDACRMAGVSVVRLPLLPEAGFVPDPDQLARGLAGADLAFICNPNNPTGVRLPTAMLEELCRAHPSVRFVVDESYLPFVDGAEEKSLAGRQIPNAVVLNSLSKVFRIPGLRVGFLIASKPLLEPMKRCCLPWSVNSLAQTAVAFLMSEAAKIEGFLRDTRQYVRSETARLSAKLSGCAALHLYPSTTIFSLIRLSEPHTASQLAARLLKHRILIRNCANFDGLTERYIRISLKQPEENDRLLDRLLAETAQGGSPDPLKLKGAEPA